MSNATNTPNAMSNANNNNGGPSMPVNFSDAVQTLKRGHQPHLAIKAGTHTPADYVGMYVNHHMWTDARPVGVIVGTYGKTGIVVQPVTCTELDWKPQVHVGGFSAHVSNNHDQRWSFEIDTTRKPIKMRLTRAMAEGGDHVNVRPVNFYDHNF